MCELPLSPGLHMDRLCCFNGGYVFASHEKAFCISEEFHGQVHNPQEVHSDVYEIQSIDAFVDSCGSCFLASIAANGRILISNVDLHSEEPESKRARVESVNIGWNGGLDEVGWFGIRAKCSGDSIFMAVCSSWAQRSAILQRNEVIREFSCWQPPTSLCLLNDAGELNQFSCADMSQTNVFDCRVGNSEGCVARIEDDCGWTPRYCDWDPDYPHMFVVAGARSINLFDTRKWKSVTRQIAPVKHSILGIRARGCFSKGSILVAGADCELLDVGSIREISHAQNRYSRTSEDSKASVGIAETNEPSRLSLIHHQGIRGDSTWIGIDIQQDMTAVALTRTGMLIKSSLQELQSSMTGFNHDDL